MAGGILGIATSGLQAFQRAMNTTGHNIANVNTEGYSRQRVDLTESPPQFTGAGYVGTGVKTAGIERVYNNFLETQLRSSTSSHGEIASYQKLAVQVDNLLADPAVGLSPVLRSFFNAVHEVADDPTAIPARQVLLSEANTLSDRFATLNGQLDQLRAQANKNLANSVQEINNLATSIAKLNGKIASAPGNSTGIAPNDLLDQRDLLVKKLAEKVDLSVVKQDNGAINVFIGKGQAMVMGAQAATLNVQPSELDPARLDIIMQAPNTNTVITESISGGELGGTLRFRDEMLDPSQNALGRIATGLADAFNQVHEAGYDLKGASGLRFFDFPPAASEITVLGAFGNGGAITASYDDVNQLQASDYHLDYDGSQYTLIRLSDHTKTDLGGLGFPTSSVTVDGITLNQSIALATGDRFLIRPTSDAAGKLKVAIGDPSQIAAAGTVGTDPVSGAPVPLVGDNTNALALTQLESSKVLMSGSATLQDAYGQMISHVGTLTHAAEVNRTAQEGLLNQAVAAREAVSGVNLDEEAANLLKFQQAYQAAAQVVAVANSLFDTLIGAVRRS